MLVADLGDICLHYRDDGPRDGLPVVFSNGLTTDLRMWDPLLPHLPQGLRIIRYDRRGHGLSDAPEGLVSMGQLIRDTERLLDHIGAGPCVFVGLSIGGMVAQGLAVKRPDLIRALVLSNTAARIGTLDIWHERMAAARQGGVAAIVDASLTRWFTPAFRALPEIALWRNMVLRTPLSGYLGGANAIAGTDFFTPLAGLRRPCLGIAGDHDGSIPPDLVRETTLLVPDAEFVLIRGAGHLPHVEKPSAYANALTNFLSDRV